MPLIVLGYAFGGNVKNLTVAIVDQDSGLPAVKVRELAGAVAANARTFDTVPYASEGEALEALRDGRVNGVLTIPPDYSRRVVGEREPRLALIEDNTDNFVAATLARSMNGMVAGLNEKRPSADRVASRTTLDVVELYPYVPYVQYLLPGSITMSIFMMVMIGGGIIFIDDKARGLHEGYLVTPITRLELIAGFNISGTVKAVLAGAVLMTIGSLIAGVPDPLDPMRMLRMLLVVTVTALALVSMMFLLMVRVSLGGRDRAARRGAGEREDLRGTERRTRQDRRGTERKTRQDLRTRTRDRLIEVAVERFADDGFKRVTVREICTRARANVAAINYHFGGKNGLYRAVIQRAIHVMRETNDLSIDAGRGTPAEARLRAYILRASPAETASRGFTS